MRLNLILTTLCFCCVSILFTNCKKEENRIIDEAFLVFHPTECTHLISRACVVSGPAYTYYVKYETSAAPIATQDFGLWLMTGEQQLPLMVASYPNLSPKNIESGYRDNPNKKEAEHLTKVEKQMQSDYENRGNQATRSTRGQVADYPVDWEYRVTGVKDFNIVATTPLFGQAAGTSLNRYFSIFEFRPKQIISYRTNSLVWGYRSKNKVETIDQWLALKPMAPPAIVFRLKETPPEVPTHVQFVSILETTDGKVLRDTTEVNLKK